MKKIICYIILLLTLFVSEVQAERYKVKISTEIVADISCLNNSNYILQVIKEANIYLEPAGIELKPSWIWYKSIYKDNIDNTLDELPVHDAEVTIGFYCQDYIEGDKIGLSYVNAILSSYSKVVVNLGENQSAKLNGSLLAHEICHLFGLGHTKNKSNLMYFRTTDENVKLNNKQIIFLQNEIRKRYKPIPSSPIIITTGK